MLKHFLRPLVRVLYLYLIIALSIASDIAQLTNFNLLNYLKEHSPQSTYLVILGSFLLYLIFVIIEFNRKEPSNKTSFTGSKSDQTISTRDVNNSILVQVKKDKGD